MKFTPSNKHDIQKYFHGSFLKLKEFGDKLFYIKSVDSYEVRGTTEEGREFRLYLSENHPYEVDYILPHKSFFQYGHYACMLQRIPQRQYHRGITPQNTAIYYFDANGQRASHHVSFETLKAFVEKQKFFSLSEAYASDNASCVLNKRMMLVPKTGKIYIDFIPIAKIINSNKIYMEKKLFIDEMNAFLKASVDQQKFSVME